MGLSINSNIAGLNAQRQTQRTTNSLLDGLRQRASGLRINQAADDAAGLAIAERLRSQVRQLNAESQNLQTGINAAQTAEGALGAQTDQLQRLRELATQAANGTLTDDQRGALNAEAQQIIEEIDATAQNTDFNGTTLLDGSVANVPLGTEGQDITLNIDESTAASLGVDTVDLSTQAGASAAMDQVETALTRASQNRAELGAQENRFQRAIEQRDITAENTASSESAIRDLDYARQFVEQTRNEVLLQTGMASLAQSNLQNQVAAGLLGT